MTVTTATVHADHIGSFLRPQRLLDAARQHKAGTLTPDEFRAVQDECIREIVAFQEDCGLRYVTDGEFRRRSWSAGFIDAVSGFGLREGGVIGFHDDKQGDWGVPKSPYAKDKLRRNRPIVVDDFRFLKSAVRTGVPKVTVASPPVVHYFLGPKAVDEAVYPDVEDYFADLVAIYREEIDDLAAEGCRFFQLDETALPCNCDDTIRAAVAARGDDPDKLTERYVGLINGAIANRPASMSVGLHMCRGNLKGAWMAEGGYEPIAETVFGGLEIDTYFLEFDTPRAGDFAPLRHMPKDKTIILGLISTKTPKLESSDELKRRIDEAAKYVSIDRLGLSPQCGFSSGGGSGQVITQDDTRRKIELMLSVVDDVWGG